jgi:cytochrome c oxidase subunit III
MPETLTPDLEIIEAGHGGGGGDVPAGGDDDGGDSGSGLPGIPQRAYYTAIQLALVGIVMFFMALTSSFLVRKGLGDDWVAFALPHVLWFNSLVLLASSVTIEVARRYRHEGAVGAFRRWWAFTAALGALFVAGQLVAWRDLASQGVFLATNPSSSFFYLLTALHAVHLSGGILALGYVAFRHWQRSRISQSVAADLAAIYWHFMDGLWLFLFALLYLGR